LNTENVTEFQRRLISLREAQGYSQADFARAIGVSPRMMCHYEREAVHLPPAAVLMKMAEALGCSIDGLLDMEIAEPDGRTVEGRLLRRLREAAKLPENDRTLLIQMLDVLLAKNGLTASQ